MSMSYYLVHAARQMALCVGNADYFQWIDEGDAVFDAARLWRQAEATEDVDEADMMEAAARWLDIELPGETVTLLSDQQIDDIASWWQAGSSWHVDDGEHWFPADLVRYTTYSLPGGCCLHLVADDGNYDDETVAWCLGEAERAGHARCRRAARLLQQMTEDERAWTFWKSRCPFCREFHSNDEGCPCRTTPEECAVDHQIVWSCAAPDLVVRRLDIVDVSHRPGDDVFYSIYAVFAKVAADGTVVSNGHAWLGRLRQPEPFDFTIGPKLRAACHAALVAAGARLDDDMERS